MNYNLALVDKALQDGHAIAEKIKRASSVKEIYCLKKAIDDYDNFVDTTFGVIDGDDPFQEKNCELSFLLCLAIEAKIRHMHYNSTHALDNNYEIEEFEKYLDSKNWLQQ